MCLVLDNRTNTLEINIENGTTAKTEDKPRVVVRFKQRFLQNTKQKKSSNVNSKQVKNTSKIQQVG